MSMIFPDVQWCKCASWHNGWPKASWHTIEQNNSEGVKYSYDGGQIHHIAEVDNSASSS